jgi:large subunit ribosomal protein L29
MKKNELNEHKNKTLQELNDMVDGKKLEIIKVTMEIKAGKEKNFKKAGNLRKNLAQIKTIIKEKELANEKEEK